MPVASINAPVVTFKPEEDHIFLNQVALSNKRLAALQAGNREKLLQMGIVDRFKDMVFSKRNKSAALRYIADNFLPEANNGEPVTTHTFQVDEKLGMLHSCKTLQLCTIYKALKGQKDVEFRYDFRAEAGNASFLVWLNDDHIATVSLEEFLRSIKTSDSTRPLYQKYRRLDTCAEFFARNHEQANQLLAAKGFTTIPYEEGFVFQVGHFPQLIGVYIYLHPEAKELLRMLQQVDSGELHAQVMNSDFSNLADEEHPDCVALTLFGLALAYIINFFKNDTSEEHSADSTQELAAQSSIDDLITSLRDHNLFGIRVDELNSEQERQVWELSFQAHHGRMRSLPIINAEKNVPPHAFLSLIHT